VTASVARGDIVLVSFPFTDLSGSKVRPALVVNLVREDVLVAFISSVVASSAPEPTDFVLPITHPDFSATGLKIAGTFKLAKLVCLHHSLILRKLGRASPRIQRELDIRLSRAVGLA
jgi:mRNA interferase MazF